MNKHVRNILAVLSVIGFGAALISNSSDGTTSESLLVAQSTATNLSTDTGSTMLATSLPQQVAGMFVPFTNVQALPLVIRNELARPGWQAIQGAPQPFAVSTQVKEKLTVDVNDSDLGKVTPGERLGFTLPDGSNVTARVENTWTETNGDKAWAGHIEDDAGPDYRIVVTQGSNATFASINTSKGSYSLESLDGLGVVYKNPEMGDVAPYGSKDYLIPGE